MNDTVLNVGFRIYGGNGIGKAVQVVCAGNKNIPDASVAKSVQHCRPKLCAFVFAYSHTRNILFAVKVNTYGIAEALKVSINA